MLLLSMPARLANLKASLWLDESWVANSLLTPKLSQTLYFDRWAQSTPPLFLVTERAIVRLAGYSEPVLRIVPLLAALASLVILAVVLRRLFSPLAALLGVATAVANYWVIKYGQEVKQYGTDLLVACLMILVLERILRDGERPAHFIRLALFCCVSSFLSFISLFWYGSCVVAAALTRRYRRALALALLIAICLGVNYLAFIRPNLSPSQFKDWASNFVDLARPGASLRGLQQSFGTLFIPLNSSPARAAAWLVETVLAIGAFRAIRLSLRGDRAALTVLLGALVPILVAILVSAAHRYPILFYPRMLIWAVPCCAVLVSYAVAPLFEWLANSREAPRTVVRSAALAACFLAVIVSQTIVIAFPRPAENNRAATEFIRSQARPSDVVFVQGGMYEQFRYYCRLFSWNPAQLYVGNTDWPCCALNIGSRSANPGARDLLDDVSLAAAKARNQTLWLLLPAGTPGHWSARFASQLNSIPGGLERQGCREERNQPFGQTLVLAFSCR